MSINNFTMDQLKTEEKLQDHLSALERKNLEHLLPYIHTNGVTDIYINRPEEIILRFQDGSKK